MVSVARREGQLIWCLWRRWTRY